jgi:hypothetical protein
LQCVHKERQESPALDADSKQSDEMTKQRKLLMTIRAGLLAIVDGIEEYLDITRTKDLRRAAKDERREDETTPE